MELGQVKKFALRQSELHDAIQSYEPALGNFESLAPEARFDRLWVRFDELAALVPSYDGLTRDNFTISDRDGINLTITRSQAKTEGRLENIRIRKIEASWLATGGTELHTESLSDELIKGNRNSWVVDSLRLLEETEAAVIEMMAQHEQRMQYARLHPISEGHP